MPTKQWTELYTKPGPCLESDGQITVYDINTGLEVAAYEGLEIHKAMLELEELRKFYKQVDWLSSPRFHSLGFRQSVMEALRKVYNENQ